MPAACRQSSNAAKETWRVVARDRHLIEVVHPGAAEGAIRDREARRLDDMHFDSKAGRQAQNRAGVLRNVGLVKGDLHGRDVDLPEVSRERETTDR